MGEVVTIRKRPLSVWVLAIANGVLAAFLIAASFMAEDRGYSALGSAITGVVGLGLTVSAHATWYGYRIGRLVLLILLTLFLGLVAVQSIMVIAWSEETGYRGGIVDESMLRTVLCVAWVAMNWLFLFGKRARAFFG